MNRIEKINNEMRWREAGWWEELCQTIPPTSKRVDDTGQFVFTVKTRCDARSFGDNMKEEKTSPTDTSTVR